MFCTCIALSSYISLHLLHNGRLLIKFYVGRQHKTEIKIEFFRIRLQKNPPTFYKFYEME